VIPTGRSKKKGQDRPDKDTDEVTLVGTRTLRPIQPLPPRAPKGRAGLRWQLLDDARIQAQQIFVKIAVAQLDAGTSPASNLERLSRAAREVSSQDALVEALFFPELFDVGYDLRSLESDHAQDAPWADAELAALATETNVVLAGGVIDRTGPGKPFNAFKVVEPARGVSAVYHKRHLVSFMGEPDFLSAGAALVSCAFGGLRWGLSICYDLRFPEHSRALALDHQVDVLAIVSAWPFPRREHWRTLLRARAIENQCYVVACNRVGTAGRYTFCGSSAIIDPFGEVLAEAGSESEEWLTAEISPALVSEIRSRLPVRQDRRS